MGSALSSKDDKIFSADEMIKELTNGKHIAMEINRLDPLFKD